MIFTKNGLNIGNEKSVPYVTLHEAMYLIESDNVQKRNLLIAVMEKGALFRFPPPSEKEICDDIDRLEGAIKERYSGYNAGTLSFRCYDESNPTQHSCKFCKGQAPVLIVGERLAATGDIETVVRCLQCGQKFSLTIHQAYYLRLSLLKYYEEECKRTNRTMKEMLPQLEPILFRVNCEASDSEIWMSQEGEWQGILNEMAS